MWRLKIAFKLILSRLPIPYSVWSKLGLFRHGDMDSTSYSINVFQNHVRRTFGAESLSGKTVLELGPGDGVASAIISKAFGGRALLVDVGNFADKDVSMYQKLVGELVKRGYQPPDLSNCSSIEAILAKCDAKYYTNGLSSLKEITSNSVDLIFSQAVLEHVRSHEFLETLNELKRIQKGDGYSSHRVDLKDHLGGSLNNLRFSSRLWESTLFSQSGFYTNRIRYSQMLDMFNKAGFETKVIDVDKWDKLPVPKQKLYHEFQSYTDDELSVSGFDVISVDPESRLANSIGGKTSVQ